MTRESSLEAQDQASVPHAKPAESRLLVRCEWGAILVLLYIFSIGPMYWHWLEGKYMQGNIVIALFYEPLWRIAGWIPPLGKWLNWYIHWWYL